MDRIFVENILCSGRHGIAPGEKKKKQRFQVDLAVFGPLQGLGDRIGRTLDYARAREAARRVVEDESHNLVETIAARIAEELQGLGASRVEVTVRKLDIFGGNGVPGVTVAR